MTKPTSDGDVMMRAYGDLEEVSQQTMTRLWLILADLKGAGAETNNAFNIALQLFQDEAERMRIMTMLKFQKVSDAGRAAERLAATNRALFDRPTIPKAR